MRLTEIDYFNANQETFIAKYPEIRDELIRESKKRMPEVCVECIFFKWRFNEERGIFCGKCSLAGFITPENFKYDARAVGCPLEDEGETDETTDGSDSLRGSGDPDYCGGVGGDAEHRGRAAGTDHEPQRDHG